MLLPLLAILLISTDESVPREAVGTITGVVVNGSQAGEPIADAEVQLRAGANGVLEPVGTTKTDIYGKFSFQGVPLDSSIVYLPGANRDGVHYPGQRLQLTPSNRIEYVKIVAYDAVFAVSPLEAERHDIDIDIGERALEITETLTVSNRSRTTYVGQSNGEELPVTLRLSVPKTFDRVTFHREFYGRRFRVVDQQLVTDVPWLPGERELRFTYRVPLEESGGLFRRPLDLPSANVRVRVRSKNGQQVSCNLPRMSEAEDQAVFAAGDRQLPAGYTIELQIGSLPIPWMRHARWASLIALVSIMVMTVLASRVRAERAKTNCRPIHPSARTSRRRGKVPQRAA